MFKIRLLAVFFAISLSPRVALAEIDLGAWQTHATMAEQGAVCGAFADLMSMQSLVDEKVGRLWSERRAYSGSVIRRAAELEGKADIDSDAIDKLLNRYSMWLLNNLANPANAEILDPAARDAASDMIGDVCAGLYAQADRAILKKHPSLATCSPGQTPLPVLPGVAGNTPAACEGNTAIIAATTIKKAEETVSDMLRRLQQAQTQADDLSNEIAILKIDNDRLLREIDTNRIVATKVDDLTMENDQLRGEITGLQSERDMLTATTADLQALKQENTRLTKRTARLQQSLAGRIEVNGQLDAEMRDLQARHDALLARTDSLTSALTNARTTMIAAPTNEEMAEKNAELAATRESLRGITTERDGIAAELAMATATLETMTGTTQASLYEQPATDVDAAMPTSLALLDTDRTMAPPEPVNMPNTAPLDQPQATAPQGLDEMTEQNFVAQLGAFSSRTGALSEISRIQTNFPEKSALAALTITPSQLDDGSSIFRITTREMLAEDAQQLCSELWDGLVSCMLRAAP